ncbi:unnamed protein product, partial [Didymodactylos carnosus]
MTCANNSGSLCPPSVRKSLSTDSLKLSQTNNDQQRLGLLHIFNSCVLDKNRRVNAGELVRHFKFVAEQNSDTLSIEIDFDYLLSELGGRDQQVTFNTLHKAVESLYQKCCANSDKSNDSTPSVSKSIPSSKSASKSINDFSGVGSTSDDVSDSPFEQQQQRILKRYKHDHEKCLVEQAELRELNRRQLEKIHMLEEEYKKLEDETQRLVQEKNELVKKKT